MPNLAKANRDNVFGYILYAELPVNGKDFVTFLPEEGYVFTEDHSQAQVFHRAGEIAKVQDLMEIELKLIELLGRYV